ncbi:MAG: hypothetical protein LBK60_06725, partial [Verrucomicrobiales bacterium]|nr:hypothetical protein [Verrucomicrobiales bacterium]
NRTSPAGGLSEAAPRLAANGQTSNLTAAEYARATSPEFKARYGDWEALAKQRQFEALIDEALSGKDTRGKIILRKVTPEERAEILRQRGPDVAGLSHEITAEELRHAFNTHGQSDEASRQPNQRPLTRADLTMIPAVIDAPDEITVQPRGSNRTSIIYGRDFGNGKIEYVERVFETSQKNKPRLTTRSVWVRRATTGVKSSPTRVSTPYRNSNLPFANGRVNPDSIKIPLDKNGEPVMSQVTADADQSRPNAARPNGGTPLFAAAPYNPVKGLSDAEPTRFANATVVPPALFAAAPERRSSAEVGERWLNVARNPDSRRFGDLADREIFDTATGEVEVGKAKDIRTILREIDEEIADETIIRRETIEEDIDNPDENGKPGTTEVISFYNKSNPTSRIRVNNPDSHFVSVNSYYNEGRTATPIYQAIYAWAHNNGKVVVPDHTTTPDGLFRRNSQMLNSALRFGTTDHMRPNPETGLDWRRGEHAHNIGEMAKREAQFVSELFNGLFDGWRYDANRDTFYDDSGTAIQPAQIKARITGAIHARYPESIRWPKAGEATVRRALASREFQAMASSQSVREHATPLERPGVPESVRPPVPGAIPQGLDGRESQNTQSGLGGIEEHDSRGGLNEALYAASPERSDSNPLPSAHNLTEGVDEAELRRLLTASGGQQQGGVSPLLHGIHGLGQATDPNANAAPFDPAKQGMPPLTMRERNRTLIKGVGSAAKRLWDENTRLKKHSELQIIMAGNFQVVNAEARGTAADLIKQVKEVEAREGINAYIEAGGDLAKLKAWEEQSKGELLKRGYRAAQHLTDEQKQIAAQVSHYFKVLAQREKQWGINVNELENYVTHIWQRPSAVGAIGGGARGLSMALKYAKQRTYDTFFDGEQAGLKPVTKDIAEILATRIAASGQAILARKFVKEMSAGVAADGRWLTSVRGNFTQVVKPGDQPKGAVYLSNPRFQDKQTEDYKTLDIAALRQWKWLGKTADGTAVLGNNDIILHPDAYALMKTAFGGNWVKNLYTVQAGDSATKAALKTLTGFIKDDIFAGGKATLFSGLIPSTFHIVHQGYHAGVYEQVNPFLIFNSIVINPYQDAAQADAVRHGLMLVEDRSNQDFTRGARNSARAWDARVMNHVAKWLRDQGNLPADVAAWTLEKLRALPEAFHEMLFTSYIPKLKWLTYQKRLELYRKLYAKELADGTASLDDIKFMAASHANAAYGGLNTFFVDKGLLELASTTMLAPDYFFARRAYNLKGALGAASAIGGDHKANAHAFYSFVLMSGAVYLATRALNYALSSMRGADDDDDDPWKIKDIRHAFALVIGNRSYDVRSEAQDLITMLFGQQDGVLSSVATFMHGRISPLSRLVIESMTKRNYRGEDLPQSEVWLNFLQQSIPMPLQGFLQVSQTQQDATKTAWQQLAGAMGLQVKRISPRNDLYTLAAEWRADHAKEYGIAARQPKLPTSKYTPMRYALEDGDLDRARAEFDNCWRGWARRAARAARTWWTVSKNPSMPPSPTISATARRRTRRSWIH